jgi:hypothetical protein
MRRIAAEGRFSIRIKNFASKGHAWRVARSSTIQQLT